MTDFRAKQTPEGSPTMFTQTSRALQPYLKRRAMRWELGSTVRQMRGAADLIAARPDDVES